MKRLIRAVNNTADGLQALWCHEQAFRQEVYIAIILIPLLVWLPITSLIKLLLALLLLLLFVTEALNSAIEAVIDRISLDIHPESKRAKDLGSAAVGMVIVMNIIAWIYAIYTCSLFDGLTAILIKILKKSF